MNYPRSAYVHIPFCYRRCFYCDFPIIPLGDKASDKSGQASLSINSYLDLLFREIASSPKGYPLATIYIGGGTPSLLSPNQVSVLLAKLRSHFGFQDGAEITIEMDPASFEKQDLIDFLEAGITRVSLGAQSFDDLVLQKIGRKHTARELLDSCKWIQDSFKKGDLASWSLDLIQNLPEQNLTSWQKELSNALKAYPPHLSIYDLSIEPGTVFEFKQRKGELFLPDENLAFEISQLTNSFLNKAGFSRYEISNFSLPGHSSRHNRAYWSGSGWWGFGQGATSCPWGIRFARPRDLEGYRKWVEEQEINAVEISLDFANAKPIDLDELLIVGLRRREGVDLEELSEMWGWNACQSRTYFEKLKRRWKKAIDSGLMEQLGQRFFLVNPKGMDMSNQVFVEVILWWESLPKAALAQPTL